jgi:hypothetical protein
MVDGRAGAFAVAATAKTRAHDDESAVEQRPVAAD